MISSKDIVKLRMPYPNVSSDLAVYSHMYICNEPGADKQLLKIQSFKNKHSTQGLPVNNYYELNASDPTNPCKRDSFVDLDKKFSLQQVVIPMTLKANTDLSETHYTNIINKITQFNLVSISTDEFLQVNSRCSRSQ
ncbi:MAG TPA: hypothetical protein K8V56_01290 [Sporosarcina psychrophila]|uniref:Uncharacterized protein n=1 Tax=Sporosarcina psychrophila TaxID=1476 RepID=A0A921FWN3_SPOPS|nr:hypothetical protein [Sporosarcina psychrophila]